MSYRFKITDNRENIAKPNVVDPLRLVFIVPSLVGGGAERQLVLLARNLVRRGVLLHVLFTHSGELYDSLRKTGAVLHHVKGSGNHDPRLFILLGRIIRHVNPDVIQTWMLQSDIIGGTVARLYGIPWLLSERCGSGHYGKGLKNILRLVLGRRSSMVAANSQYGCEYWQINGYRGPAVIVRNIIERDRFSAELEVGTREEEIFDKMKHGEVILGVGRLEEQKNWQLIMYAFDRIAALIPNVALVILGEGSMRGELEAIRLGLANGDRIFFPGFSRSVVKWLQRSCIFVSCSSYEGNPNAVLEAIVEGVPIVLSDIPAHREVLSGDQASYVSLGDPQAWGEAIRNVIADLDVRNEAALTLKKHWMERMATNSIVDSWMKIYNKLCNFPGGDRK